MRSNEVKIKHICLLSFNLPSLGHLPLNTYHELVFLTVFFLRMSSEDKTVEPSDQGPSPPSSSVGATSTGSPALADKRPRGRPRKDAAAAAILPQAPPSSTPKNRKK